MSTLRFLSVLPLSLGFLMGSVALAQELPQAGPEHKELKKMEGTWDCVIKSPGMPNSKGVATYKMECNDLWLTSNFEGDFGGLKFQGKGLDTYDASEKKFVSVWVDSMSTQPIIFKGTMDADGKTINMAAEGTGPDGKPAKFRGVTSIQSEDKQTFTLYMTPQGGDESLMMTLEYTRRGK